MRMLLAGAVLGLATIGPAAADCGATDAVCLAAEAAAVDKSLAEVRDGAAAAIATWDGNLSEEDRSAWTARLAEETATWDRWRALRCAGAGAGEADALACRIGLGRVAAADLAARYDLGYGAYRLDVETPSDPDAQSESENAAADEEYGPCSDAPPADCDHCGVNACFEALETEVEGNLSAALAGALRRTAPEAAAALRAEQAAWTAWRDLACENAAWETPNRWAHSVYALTIGPCRIAETEARIRRLSEAGRAGP